QDLATFASDREISQYELLDGVIVPFFPRRDLVMPNVGAGVGVERHDRGQEQVVALIRTALPLVPFKAIADAEIDEIELGIVRYGVPHPPPPARLPPLATPGLGGIGHGLVLEWFGGVTRHGVEAPR